MSTDRRHSTVTSATGKIVNALDVAIEIADLEEQPSHPGAGVRA